jgi:hypothetical protein
VILKYGLIRTKAWTRSAQPASSPLILQVFASSV